MIVSLGFSYVIVDIAQEISTHPDLSLSLPSLSFLLLTMVIRIWEWKSPLCLLSFLVPWMGPNEFVLSWELPFP